MKLEGKQSLVHLILYTLHIWFPMQCLDNIVQIIFFIFMQVWLQNHLIVKIDPTVMLPLIVAVDLGASVKM